MRFCHAGKWPLVLFDGAPGGRRGLTSPAVVQTSPDCPRQASRRADSRSELGSATLVLVRAASPTAHSGVAAARPFPPIPLAAARVGVAGAAPSAVCAVPKRPGSWRTWRAARSSPPAGEHDAGGRRRRRRISGSCMMKPGSRCCVSPEAGNARQDGGALRQSLAET